MVRSNPLQEALRNLRKVAPNQFLKDDVFEEAPKKSSSAEKPLTYIKDLEKALNDFQILSESYTTTALQQQLQEGQQQATEMEGNTIIHGDSDSNSEQAELHQILAQQSEPVTEIRDHIADSAATRASAATKVEARKRKKHKTRKQ